MHRAKISLLAGLLVTSFPSMLQANLITAKKPPDLPVNQGYLWSGLCSDCTGTATATLTLHTYLQGTPILSTNFVSFTYDGTDRAGAYTILPAALSSIAGNIPLSLPSVADFQIVSSGALPTFATHADGSWVLGNDDFGASSSFSPAPEPASYALVAGALVLLATATRGPRQINANRCKGKI